MHPLMIFGLLFNSALIVARRFWRKFPDWLYLPGMILGIAAMLAGIIIFRA